MPRQPDTGDLLLVLAGLPGLPGRRTRSAGVTRSNLCRQYSRPQSCPSSRQPGASALLGRRTEATVSSEQESTSETVPGLCCGSVSQPLRRCRSGIALGGFADRILRIGNLQVDATRMEGVRKLLVGFGRVSEAGVCGRCFVQQQPKPRSGVPRLCGNERTSCFIREGSRARFNARRQRIRGWRSGGYSLCGSYPQQGRWRGCGGRWHHVCPGQLKSAP